MRLREGVSGEREGGGNRERRTFICLRTILPSLHFSSRAGDWDGSLDKGKKLELVHLLNSFNVSSVPTISKPRQE